MYNNCLLLRAVHSPISFDLATESARGCHHQLGRYKLGFSGIGDRFPVNFARDCNHTYGTMES